MGNKLLFLILIFSKTIFCQTLLKGKVLNTKEVEGIHVSDISNNNYTITNLVGEFELLVSINDTIKISGLLYKTKTLLITESVLKSKQFEVYLSQTDNVLETVYMGNKLSGNLGLDIKSIKTEVPIELSLTNSFKGLGKYKGVLKTDNQSSILKEPLPGIDIIGLIMFLIPISDKVVIPDIIPLPFSRNDLVLYYGMDFYSKDLQLLKEDEERFIQFSELDAEVIRSLKKRDKFQLLNRLLKLRKQFIDSKWSIYSIFFILFIVSCFGQKTISGKIISTSEKEFIHVLNKTNNKYTVTNINGEFTIDVRYNDTLIFSGLQYKLKEVVISKKKLNSMIVTVFLEESVNELDAVYIKPNLSGEFISRFKKY